MSNRLARTERRENFKAFAAIVSIPLMFALAAVFDGGAMGEIVRAFIGAAIN